MNEKEEREVTLIGHKSCNEEIEDGVHLRWTFKQKMGFPTGGFRLYRRSYEIKPQKGIWFSDYADSAMNFFNVEIPTGIFCDDEILTLKLIPKTSTNVPWKITSSYFLTLESDTSFEINVIPSYWLRGAKIRGFIGDGGFLSIRAYAEGELGEVDEIPDEDIHYVHDLFVVSPFLPVDFIDSLKISGCNAYIQFIDIIPFKNQTWKLIYPKINSNPSRDIEDRTSSKDFEIESYGPVKNRRKKKVLKHKKYLPAYPDILKRPPILDKSPHAIFLPTSWAEAEKRLPNNISPTLENKYKVGFKESFEILDTLTDNTRIIPMGARIISKEGISEPPSNKLESPKIYFSALDLLMIASLDPILARIFGLYFVDKKIENSDYMIVGNWLEGTLWDLENSYDFERYPLGKKLTLTKYLSSTNNLRGVRISGYYAGTMVEIETPNKFGDLSRGLFIESSSPNISKFKFDIRFQTPVSHVQIFFQQSCKTSTILMAYFKTELVDEVTFTPKSADKNETILAVEARSISRVELIGKEVVLVKICCDEEYIPHGEYSHIITPISNDKPRRPTSLTTTWLPLATKKDYSDAQPILTGIYSKSLLGVGLRWALHSIEGSEEGLDLQDPACSPVRYNIIRRISPERTLSPDIKSQWVLVTKDPIAIIPFDESDEPQPFKGWPPPAQRQFFIDDLKSVGNNLHNECSYAVAGIDIFGRQGEYSDIASVKYSDIASVKYGEGASVKVDELSLPPPPVEIRAKFLDPGDLWLSGVADILTATGEMSEKDWVGDEGFGIRIDWKWTERLKRQAPDAKKFHIYYHPGWLNQIQGEIIDIQDNGDETSTIITDHVVETTNLAPSYLFEDISDHVQVQGKFFPIIQSYLVKQTDLPDLPAHLKKSPFRISEKTESFKKRRSLKVGQKFFTAKEEGTPLKEKPTVLDEKFEPPSIEKSSSPKFKLPELTYYYLVLKVGQVGVEPPKESPQKGHFVLPILYSSPLHANFHDSSNWTLQLHVEEIMDVQKTDYQIVLTNPPLIPTQEDLIRYAQIGISTSNDIGEGPVSPPVALVAVYREPPPKPKCPDAEKVYASLPDFHGKSSFEFRWPKQSGMAYEVCRAMDSSVFRIDKATREARPKDPNHDTYAELFTDFSMTYPADYSLIKEQIEEMIQLDVPVNYWQLTNYQLQALASLEGNEAAFAKIHDAPIKWDDPKHVDPEDPTKMLYIDDTLDGRAENRYFYRVRAIDQVGNQSNLSLSTVPIYLPDTPPPKTPVMTRVLGRDRQVTLEWNRNAEKGMHSYHLYRTRDEGQATDVRLMEKIAEIPADAPDSPLYVLGGIVKYRLEEGPDRPTYIYRVDEYDYSTTPDKQTCTAHSYDAWYFEENTVSSIELPDWTEVVLVFQNDAGEWYHIDKMLNQLSHTDTDLWGNQVYYYRLVAIREGQVEIEKFQKLHSSPSKLISAKTFNLSPPQPPSSTNIIRSEEGPVTIEWTVTEPSIRGLLQRRMPESAPNKKANWITISNWLEPISNINAGTKWKYKFIDRLPDVQTTFYYRLKLINLVGKVLNWDILEGE